MTDQEHDEFERELFRRVVLDPDQWIAKADALSGAAAKFEHELNEAWTNVYVSPFARRMIRDALPVYLMLAAYAVENLLKALLVLKNRDDHTAHVTTKHELPPQLKSHDLVRLADASGAIATAYAYRRELLQRLARSAVWYGRYPVPLAHDRREPAIANLNGSDIDEVRSLLRDLRDEYEAQQKEGGA
jgi:hypothetical protein